MGHTYVVGGLPVKKKREKLIGKILFKFVTLNFVKIHLVAVKLFLVDRKRQQLCFRIANTPKTVHKEMIMHNVRSSRLVMILLTT
jgi:hypothetical protein